MIDTVQNQLAAGNYAAAIQDALGNQGASVRITSANGNISVAISGTPSGLPESAATTPSRATDTVTLSPEAQSRLSDATVALDILTTDAARATNGTISTGSAGNKPAGDVTTGSQTSQQTQTIGQLTAASGTPKDINATQATTDPTGGAAASPSVADIIAAAQAAAQDPNYAYNQLGGNPNALAATLSTMGSDAEKSSFLAAFDNRTLTVTNTSDIPGFDYASTTVLTGTSETMSGSGDGYNAQVEHAAQMQGGGYGMLLGLPLGGAILVTWGPGATTA